MEFLKDNTIKRRVVRNFLLVIFISIAILEALLIGFVKEYYYKSMESILTNQIKTSADFYSRYFSNSSLEENIVDNVDVFWKQTNAEVQIISLSGKVLMDSIGVVSKENIDTIDVKKALKGEKGKWVGNVEYDKNTVMAIAYPLTSDDNVVGVIRFITSMEGVNKSIYDISIIFIIIGLIVLFISAIISLLFANSIINPIKELTEVANFMAQGNFKIRSKKKTNDEIGKLSDTLNYMAEEITEKDQLKNEFISRVSHELRTPLTSIKGWTVTIKDEETDRVMVKEGLDIIEKECDRLTKMVEELLDFSRFVSEKVVLEKKKINVIHMIHYIEKYMKPRAERERIKLYMIYDNSIPEIYLDVNRMKQVLINILDNAFKFTGEGGEIKLSVTSDNENMVMVIKDNGCGISQEDLPRVKEKFYKGKSSKSQNGIGLSICDEIVKLHGGTLEIYSKVGEGTRVCIKIPFNNN